MSYGVDVLSISSSCTMLQVEIAGSVEEGILASFWSPDQELLALVTGDNWVSLVNSQYLPVAKFSLQQQEFGEAEPVVLGWGKKETQFHGTEGKQAAKEVLTVESGLAADDDGSPRISWKGDGQMFAINYVDLEKNIRKLMVVNREGIVQYTSEPVSKLEQSLSWKPSGSLITSTQRLPNKYQVVFFEKNGLRHGEFTFPDRTNCFVKELMWNMNSTVLLVWFHPIKEIEDEGKKDIEKVHYVQLWSMKNYEWYLKAEMPICDVQDVSWDDLGPLDLFIANTKCISRYTWNFCVHKSSGSTQNDLTIVSVINGKKLLLTPFRKVSIPPPKSAYEITFPDQIHTVCYLSGTDSVLDSNSLCVLHGNFLTLLSSENSLQDLDQFGCKVDYTLGRSPNFKTTFPVHKAVAQYNLSEVDKNLFNNARHWEFIWAKSETFYCINSDSQSHEQVVLKIHISGMNVDIKKLETEHGPFLNMTCHKNAIFFQDVNGKVHKLKHETGFIEPTSRGDRCPIAFHSPCIKMEVSSNKENVLIFGLTNHNRLYYESKLLVTNCSSFHIHNDHLLLTTTSHQMLMVPLDENVLTSVAGGLAKVVGERNIERGSKLVTAVSDDSKVVMQMPRGNLEIVHPRPLLVHILKRFLDQRQYHEAVELMRKHRVDMNLVYDHDPVSFMQNCNNFVKSVNNAEWIDLFVASLKNEDTTSTLHSFNYQLPKIEKHETSDNISKVDRICIAVRESMIQVDEQKYLLPILSSYVKMDTSQMDEALRKLKDLKDANRTDLPITTEEGLRHLLYFADANILCDVALGTYDFDLVMMVFEKSQKDPKEFLPFLNKLKKMEKQYMKYSINVHLKRYRRAFECIKATGADHTDECLLLVKKEINFSIALEEFMPNTPLYRAVAEAYGDYNLGKGYYGEAGLLYERAGKYSDALEAYKQLGNWKRAFIIAIKMGLTPDQMLELYESTVEVLKEKNMYFEAANVYKDYLKNEEEAVTCLTFAQCWDDAIGIVYKVQRQDLIETTIMPAVVEQYNSYERDISSMSQIFSSHCSRLLIVRANITKERHDLLEGGGDDNLDSDMYCDTSTVTGASHSRGSKSGTGSNTSGRTYRSAKNRKKLERKKHSTKEGSSYEDLGLITELHALITRADALARPVGAIVAILFSFENDSQAAHLQEILHNLLRLMESKEKIIWPSDDPETPDDLQGMVGGAHMSTAELLRVRQGAGVSCNSETQLRLKQLEPSLRHPPKLTRPIDWALGFLHKKKLT